MTSIVGRLLAVGLLLALVVPAGAAERPARERALSDGLVQQLWNRGGDVHVARADAGSAAVLRVVQAATLRERETPSSLCRRTPGCRVAVNGDYFDADGPRGGVAAGGRLLRSPRPGHLQLQVAPVRAVRPTAQEPGWSGSVADATGEVRLAAVNVPAADALVLWTAAYAATTPACTCRELALRQLDGDAVDRLGGTSRWRVAGAREGGSGDLRAGPVLAASGAALAALDRLAASGEVVLRLAKGPSQALGGHPLVLRDGEVVALDPADTAQHERHPRTALGWHADGRRWLLVADGRREGSPGLTAAEVAGVLRRLGASHGALLDGGGSSTFVVDGKVANRPSDGQERAVSNVLLLVEPPKAAPALTPGPSPASLRTAEPAPHAAAPAAVAPPVAKPLAPEPEPVPTKAEPPVAPEPVVAQSAPAQAPSPVQVAAPRVDTAQVVAIAAAAISDAIEADPSLRRAVSDVPSVVASSLAAPEPSPGAPLPTQVAALLVAVAAVLFMRAAAAVRAENAARS